MASPYESLGRRERQIMDVLFREGQATAAEVLAALSDPPSYSSVRSMLRLLETKGFVSHQWDGPRHVYRPTASPTQLRRSAARHMLRTFFDDSMVTAVSALLGAAESPPTDEELDRLSRLIEDARRKGARS
jgi:predicted transcriptional regulator